MALILDALLEILKKPTMADIASELAVFAAPLSIALLAGLLAGWVWRPKWASALVTGFDNAVASPVGLLGFDSSNGQLPRLTPSRSYAEEEIATSTKVVPGSGNWAVKDEDFDYLYRLVEERDGGPAWIRMMDRSLPSMTYNAWRRDVEKGPPQYRTSTVFEDATPEVMRDFFWSDEFRIKNGWDDMLLHHATLEESPTTGTMVVQWIRKFPFFCSDREYCIGRRIWESGRAYYCVTKGVPCPSLPRRNKPRRVDLYYSSWCIRAVESKRGDGQMTACEVLLFHYEDMGIPWEIAKLGIRQGMWGCVKKIEPGLRAYQIEMSTGEPPSHCAEMARINTKFNANYLRSLEADNDTSGIEGAKKQKPWGLSKFFLVGGVVALACTLDQGLLTKAAIFGVARRFGKLGRRL